MLEQGYKLKDISSQGQELVIDTPGQQTHKTSAFIEVVVKGGRLDDWLIPSQVV